MSNEVIADLELPPHTNPYHFLHPPNFRPVPVLLYLTPTQISAVSGALSGFLAGVAVCPLDVAKTRLQAQGTSLDTRKKYTGLFQSLSKIYTEEGVRGLYRGLVPITIGYLPSWMIYFTVYEKAKKIYPSFLDPSLTLQSYVAYSLSAITAGAASTVFTNPVWVVKTRLMMQTATGLAFHDSKAHYSGTYNAFATMYRTEGIKVFYSGLVPSLFGLFHVAIHFPIYELLKKTLRCDPSLMQIQANKLRILEQNDSQAKKERFYFFVKLILASSLSKMCASTITYPHEVLRTRLQIALITNGTKMSLIGLIKAIYRLHGIRGFYSGYTTNLMRTVPSLAVTLVSFEFIKLYFEKINV